ncbi:MAG: hypothetical protein ACLR23_22180, partial [Clostridia bacterium]
MCMPRRHSKHENPTAIFRFFPNFSPSLVVCELCCGRLARGLTNTIRRSSTQPFALDIPFLAGRLMAIGQLVLQRDPKIRGDIGHGRV